MKLSSKKIGLKLGEMAAKHPHLVKDAAKDIAKFIIKNGKTNKLSEIIRYFKTSYNKETETVDLTVTASKHAYIPQIKEIAGMKVAVKEVVDESLIGGIKIETDDILIDGSIKGKLEKLRSVGR